MIFTYINAVYVLLCFHNKSINKNLYAFSLNDNIVSDVFKQYSAPVHDIRLQSFFLNTK